MSFDDNTLATFRDVEKMDGYKMSMDGFVLDMEFSQYPETPTFMALKSKVLYHWSWKSKKLHS